MDNFLIAKVKVQDEYIKLDQQLLDEQEEETVETVKCVKCHKDIHHFLENCPMCDEPHHLKECPCEGHDTSRKTGLILENFYFFYFLVFFFYFISILFT